jgi:alanine dehydrogenase
VKTSQNLPKMVLRVRILASGWKRITSEVEMSTTKPHIGLPKMHVEPGERRVFMPEFVAVLQNMGFEITLEHEYGSPIDVVDAEYLKLADKTRFADLEEVYQQDHVLVLRYPDDELVRKMRPGACLISMLHYPTRPLRVELLREQNLQAVSLDSIRDDSNRRLVENLPSVAWNGLRISMSELGEVYPAPGFENSLRPAIRVTLIGAGAVGKHVIQAAVAYGDPNLRQKMLQKGVPGVMLQVLDYDLTGHAEFMREIFSKTDILIDATQRPDPSQPVISNAWIAWLPEHAIITDLSVDPYLLDSDPQVVRGIEGIPQGSLDKYVFKAVDPDWDLTVPPSIASDERRTVVSCYSWPGIFPEACMQHYAEQLTPLMKRLVKKTYNGLSLDGDFFERALYRGTLTDWLKNLPQ